MKLDVNDAKLCKICELCKTAKMYAKFYLILVQDCIAQRLTGSLFMDTVYSFNRSDPIYNG